MNKVEYIGEHLWVGQAGHFFILLAFVAVLFSAYSYYKTSRHKENGWMILGRSGFVIHGISILAVIGLIFYAMVNKMYEYVYVYRTVADDLPMQYLLAAFWEDQEGSFLLWMFWHVILGFILLRKAGNWEAPVMTTLCLIQGFIGSMLLGLYLPFIQEDIKIGSNPFALIRDVFEGPIFANADYLSIIEGQGLNPLLQNYWMTIHPPTLFLGFASVSVPFCFAIAGLALRKHREVLSSILKWSIFSAFILGLGILMGGAWAYEALTFGGYWAWDPVENTSLVPWLILVAGIHTNLIAKNTGYAIKGTYIYYLLAFLLILYSTFLTRSGILGETSVHAFTTMGLETQLIVFIVFFLGLGIFKYWRNAGSVPTIAKEEPIYSREFWMFIGALILFFSGILMTISTSLPVYNEIARIFNPNHIGRVIDDPIHHHNKYQIWIGIFIGILSGVAILLRYNGLNWTQYKKKFIRHVAISSIIALVITTLIQIPLHVSGWQQMVFLFAGLFAITSNIQYLTQFLKVRLKLAGSTFSHAGFGILILGIMFSGLNNKTISTNPFVTQDILDQDAANKAIVLIKNEPFFTSEYWVNYVGDTLVGNLRKYQLNFRQVNQENETIDSFSTFPSAIYSNDFTKIEAVNPGTKHKLHYDVFTQVVPPLHLQDIENAKAVEDSLKYLSYLVTEGEIVEEESYSLRVGALQYDSEAPKVQHGDDTEYDLVIRIPVTIESNRTKRRYEVNPGLGLRDALIYQFPEVIDDLGIKIKVDEDLFNQVFSEETELKYEELVLKEGETRQWGSYSVRLDGFDRSPQHRNYTAQDGDIALGAVLSFASPDREDVTLKPIFIIRNAQQFSIKDYSPTAGIHVRFTEIDPLTETMKFRMANDERKGGEIELLIADGVPRSDILIMEANIFPGINLVWLGSLMMLGGLFMSLLAKRS